MAVGTEAGAERDVVVDGRFVLAGVGEVGFLGEASALGGNMRRCWGCVLVYSSSVLRENSLADRIGGSLSHAS